MLDIVDQIMAYESGEMEDEDVVRFFAQLIKDGTCWQLQGHYGRVATSLIEQGIISRSGEVLVEL